MTNNEDLGCWTDPLSDYETTFSKEAAKKLEDKAPWAKKLLCDPKIRNAINIEQNESRTPTETKQIKAALFEVRFAYALYLAGLTAEYEYKTGVANSTVDFKLNSDPNWLIELTSLRESKAVKDATLKSDDGTVAYVSTTEPGSNSPETLDLIKAQQAIFSKVANKDGILIFPRKNVHLN